ncbi:peptide deformylase [Streptosporangium canum]|uniref:peptide deformylase n=1 Tax=Streptosporangium canum TaxID=324952 RepID=UPI003F4C4E97
MGTLARVLQHEADHLDGILFIDRLPADERERFPQTPAGPPGPSTTAAGTPGASRRAIAPSSRSAARGIRHRIPRAPTLRGNICPPCRHPVDFDSCSRSSRRRLSSQAPQEDRRQRALQFLRMVSADAW